MTVDRANAVTLEDDIGGTVYFCSEHCRHTYAAGRTAVHVH
jgi:YHS domain-containing protein